MTSADLSSTVPAITTIEVHTPDRSRSGKLLRAVAPYFVVPIATGILFVSAVAAVAHPVPALVSCIALAAVVGPGLDIWRRRRHKARRNVALKGSGSAK